MTKPTCPYCSTTAKLVDGSVVYPHRPDLVRKLFWRCPKCTDAYVGCHPNSNIALGRLANAELRAAKQRAHAVFDALWQAKAGSGRGGITKGQARASGYAWLAQKLGLPPAICHVGMFDVDTCNRVVALCQPYADRLSR